MRATRSVRRRRGGEGGYVRDGDSFENNEEAGGENARRVDRSHFGELRRREARTEFDVLKRRVQE